MEIEHSQAWVLLYWQEQFCVVYTSFKESQTLKNGSFLLDKAGRPCFNY